MANCSSCNGCSGRGCTRVGALGTLCRTGCRNPYYTGPCPPAPCTDGCGNCSSGGCSCCRCRRNAAVTSCSSCGCNNGCSGNCCGCGCNDGCSDHGCGCNNGCSGNCGCNDCDDCDDCDRRRGREYGVFTLNGSVHLDAGGAAEFTPGDVNPDCFACKKDGIILRRRGLYRAVLTADIPKFTEAETVLSLDLNGSSLPGADLAVDVNDCASAMNYTAEAIFEAVAGAKLKLFTSGSLNISCVDNRNIIRLILYRI